MNLKKKDNLEINSGFNSFAIDNLTICLSPGFRPSTIYSPCIGDLNVLSTMIENSKARHVVR